MEFDKPINAATDWLCGTWEVGFTETRLILRREPAQPTQSGREYGLRFEIRDNGEFVEYFTAPCGNDQFIHHWIGNWKLSEDDQTLILQIENHPIRFPSEKLRPTEAYKKGQEFEIIERADEEVQLQLKALEVEWAIEALWKYERQK